MSLIPWKRPHVITWRFCATRAELIIPLSLQYEAIPSCTLRSAYLVFQRSTLQDDTFSSIYVEHNGSILETKVSVGIKSYFELEMLSISFISIMNESCPMQIALTSILIIKQLNSTLEAQLIKSSKDFILEEKNPLSARKFY